MAAVKRTIKLPSCPERHRHDLDERVDRLLAVHPAADELSQTLLTLARTLREIEAYEPGLAAALLLESERLLADWRR